MVLTGWNRFRAFLSTGRWVQVTWLLFMLIVLSLALPGIIPLRQLLQTVCSGDGCLVGQLTLAEEQAAFTFGNTLAEYASYIFIIYLSIYLLLLLTASILIWRKSAHAGAASGAFFLASLGTMNLVMVTTQENPHLILPARILQIIQLSTLLPFFGQIPDGHFRPGWLRWIALGMVPVNAMIIFGMGGPAARTMTCILIALFILGSQIYRYRTMLGSPQQEPATWTLTGTALLATAQLMGKPIKLLPLPAITVDMLPTGFFGFFTVFGMLLVVGALTCLAVALLGDDLFRVDVALNRAIVYTFLTLFVIGAYVLVIGYLSIIFQSSGSLWFSLVATGVVAALFHPLREWVQRFVNRMIYGERDDPYSVIAQLGERLEIVIATDEVIPTILHTVREALKVSYVAIALRQPGENGFMVAADEGRAAQIALTLPLVYQNESVGQLQLAPRAGEHSFSLADRRLLDGLARQAGVAIHAARLNADLQHAREQLVITREEERRRIRRDLHDGLGASLAALNLQAGEIQRLMGSDPETANELVADLRAGIRASVNDIRRLVYGLRPPALDEFGLLEALRSRILQYQAVPVKLARDGAAEDIQPPLIHFAAPAQLSPLPAAVEVAVYRIVEEGLANVEHHARAKNCWIQLALEEHGICVEIQDDGSGLPEVYQPGIGLSSMRERATELGGTWSIQSDPGKGTQMRAWLPLTYRNREE